MLEQKEANKDRTSEGSFNDIHFRPIHPFPARMAPSIALDSLMSCGQKPLRVLDPMTGSGTTCVVAKSLGHNVIGFDTDPLAVLIANAWCTEISKDNLLGKAADVLERATKRYEKLPLREAYPRDADVATRAFVKYWFDSCNRRQLASLAETISRLHNPGLKTVLWCAFSRLIITKKIGVSLAMDISHSRPHRVYDNAPIKPFDKFLAAVEVVSRSLPFTENKNSTSNTRILLGDARKLPLKSRSIDIVVTSPPYLNAIDYIRGHKLSLIWMGYPLQDLRHIRSSNVGAENSISQQTSKDYVDDILDEMGAVERLPERIRGMLLRYVSDMDSVLCEISRVLKIKGRAVLVIGDSTLKGTFIQNSKALTLLGKRHGLDLQSVVRRELQENRRYLPPPTAIGAGPQLRGRMREEAIMTFCLCS